MGELESRTALRRITIVGGGNIGAKLASEIDQEYAVKLVELSPERASDTGGSTA